MAITRVSGETGFLVSGDTVQGQFQGSHDTSGTVGLHGTFASIAFTALYTVTSGGDGIYLQLGTSYTSWRADTDGVWTNSLNWTTFSPNGPGATATFGPVITAPRNVSLDAARVVGEAEFDSPKRYTLAGPGTLTLQSTGSLSAINGINGSHTISAPINFASSTNVTVNNAGDTLTISGDMSASPTGTLGKFGPGTLEVKHLRIDGVDVEAGKIAVLASGSSNATSGASKIKSLIIASSAKLDVTNNAMVIDYDGASPIDNVRSMIASAYNSGSWNGNGLTSSSAAGDAQRRTAIGLAEAGALRLSSFAGQSADGTSLVLAYALYGDANLDGTVDTVDFNLLAASFSQSGKVWARGDFNYDGAVDTVDFNLLASNFSLTLPSNMAAAGAPGIGALVPEPGIASIALGGLLALRRRRRALSPQPTHL